MIDSGHKLCFDLLSHYKDVESIKSSSSTVRNVFSWSDTIERFGIDEQPSILFNFIKTVLHDDKCEYFFKIMWDGNASKDVREYIGRTVSRALLKGIKIAHKCREDPERRTLPIVNELHAMLIDIHRIFFDVLKNRQFQ